LCDFKVFQRYFGISFGGKLKIFFDFENLEKNLNYLKTVKTCKNAIFSCVVKNLKAEE
jgi:hypothetical protein